MLTDEIALSIAHFFDRVGPSHDQIGMLVRRAGLSSLDPGSAGPDGPIGKMRRIRQILTTAAEQSPDRGERLVHALVDALRSHGSFIPSNADYPGIDRLRALQSAFRNEGFELDDSGRIYALNLDALEGQELESALTALTRRALRGADDGPLLIGTTKQLMEACARIALETTTGSYPPSIGFDGTLYQAFDRLDMAAPTPQVREMLHGDPRKAFEQALWLLAVTANRLRNEFGTGHGHTSTPSLEPSLPRLTGQAGGLVSRALLDRLHELGLRTLAGSH